MSGGARLLIAMVVGVVIVGAASVSLVAASVYRAGTIEVDVREGQGGGVSVNVPAGLAELVLFFIPDHSLSRALDSHVDPSLRELQRNLPAIREAWARLGDAPDFTMVEVASENGSVRVEKRGGLLLVEVDSEGDRCEVSLPLRTVSRALRKI